MSGSESQLPEPPITVAEHFALWRVALDADASLMRNPLDRFIARRRLRKSVRALFVVANGIEAEAHRLWEEREWKGVAE